MERKIFSSPELKVIDPELGIIESIIAVMGNIDEGGDIIHSGAFTKTITERAGKIRVLDLHRSDSIMRVLGKPLSLREMSAAELPPQVKAAYPDATGALVATTQFLMNTPEGMGAFQRYRAGAADEWSIGYDAIDADYSDIERNGKRVTVRNLRTLRLHEYSPVIFAMNPATTTLSAKNDDREDEEKAGRQISTVNSRRLMKACRDGRKALSDIEELLRAAGYELEDDEEEPDEMSKDAQTDGEHKEQEQVAIEPEAGPQTAPTSDDDKHLLMMANIGRSELELLEV